MREKRCSGDARILQAAQKSGAIGRVPGVQRFRDVGRRAGGMPAYQSRPSVKQKMPNERDVDVSNKDQAAQN